MSSGESANKSPCDLVGTLRKRLLAAVDEAQKAEHIKERVPSAQSAIRWALKAFDELVSALPDEGDQAAELARALKDTRETLTQAKNAIDPPMTRTEGVRDPSPGTARAHCRSLVVHDPGYPSSLDRLDELLCHG